MKVSLTWLLLGVAATSISSVLASSSSHHGVVQQVAVLPEKQRGKKSAAFVVHDKDVVPPTTSSPPSIQQRVNVNRGGAVAAGGGNQNNDAIIGALLLTIIERSVDYVFQQNNIDFPSMLGGCGVLFVGLLLANLVKGGLGDTIFGILNPGAVLLAKWLPVFFVPGLAMLPLAPSVGSGLEVSSIFLNKRKKESVVETGWILTREATDMMLNVTRFLSFFFVVTQLN